jgi:hypothetical protein
MNFRISLLTSDKSVYYIANKGYCDDNYKAYDERNVVESYFSIEFLVFTDTTWSNFEIFGASLDTEIIKAHVPARWTAYDAYTLCIKHPRRTYWETLFDTIKIL